MSDKDALQVEHATLEIAIREHLNKAFCDLPRDLAERVDRQFTALVAGLMWDRLTPIERLHAAKRFDELTQHQMQLKRQSDDKKAEGRYTLEEAAEAIATSGESVDVIQEKLCASTGRGELATYEPGKRARLVHAAGSPVRWYYEEAYWDDLNGWLEEHETRIPYRFPSPSPKANSANTVRLSENQREEIRRRATAGERQQDLADEFAVSRQYVNKLVNEAKENEQPRNSVFHRRPR